METQTTTGAKGAPRMKAEGGDASPDGRTFKGKRGVRRLINATRYSRDGLIEAWRNEDAFRQELVLAVILVPLAFWLPVSVVERILLVGVVLLVLIVELLNSGIEAVVDRVSFELHDLSKRAKDLASAAVFLSLMLCGWLWAGAIWHRISIGT